MVFENLIVVLKLTYTTKLNDYKVSITLFLVEKLNLRNVTFFKILEKNLKNKKEISNFFIIIIVKGKIKKKGR